MSKKIIIIGATIAAGGLAVYGIYRYYKNQADKFKDMKYIPKAFNLQPDFDANQATLNITLQLYNPTTFDATVNSIYFDITVNGQKLGFVQNAVSFYVPAKGYSQDLQFSLTFSPKLLAADALQFAIAYIQKKDYSINYNGYISIKTAFISITEPFNYTTTLKDILAP
jgi:LEA14-like dessication related protein